MSQIQEVNLCAKESDEIEDDAKVYNLDTDDENEEDRDNDEENEEDRKPPQLVYEYDKIHDHRMVKLLKETTLQLDDGRTIQILSRGPRYSEEKWPVNCHVCSCSSMYTFERVMDHLSSSTHELNAEILKSGRKFYDPMTPFIQTVDLKDPELTPIRIHGGEVITEITRDLACRYRQPVPKKSMGISYGFKVLPDFGKNFYCMLCRQSGSISHFRKRLHASKYISKHFPKTQKKLESHVAGIPKVRQRQFVHRVIMQIYKKIADEKFEKFPKYVPLDKLKAKFGMFINNKNKEMHISEEMISISDEWFNELVLESAKIDPMITLNKNKEEKNTTSNDNNVVAPDCRSEAERWNELGRMMIPILDDLNKLYNTYKKNLESHPSYKREWGLFWKRRSIELRRAGIDPSSYDLNAEWKPFWEKRLTGLKIEKMFIESSKFQRKLDINKRAEMPKKIKSALFSRLHSYIPEPPSLDRPPVIDSRSTSSNEPPPKERCHDDSKHPTVVSVMRIAAALEDHLGSLGPQAIQLLGRAVVSEKTNTNPDTLLMDNEYYIFLMTVNEKLKGHLETKIVAQRTLDAFDYAVKEISGILLRFEELRARWQSAPASSSLNYMSPTQTRKFETAPANRLKRGRDLNTSLNYNYKTTNQPQFEEFGDRGIHSSERHTAVAVSDLTAGQQNSQVQNRGFNNRDADNTGSKQYTNNSHSNQYSDQSTGTRQDENIGGKQRMIADQKYNQSMSSSNFSGSGDCANNYTVPSGGYDLGNSSNMLQINNADRRQTDAIGPRDYERMEIEKECGGRTSTSIIEMLNSALIGKKLSGAQRRKRAIERACASGDPILPRRHARTKTETGGTKTPGATFKQPRADNVPEVRPGGSQKPWETSGQGFRGESYQSSDSRGNSSNYYNRGPNDCGVSNHGENEKSRGDSYRLSSTGNDGPNNPNYGSIRNRNTNDRFVSNQGEKNHFPDNSFSHSGSRNTHGNRGPNNSNRNSESRGTIGNRASSNLNYGSNPNSGRNNCSVSNYGENTNFRASGGRSGYGQYSNSNRDNFGDGSSTGSGGHWRTGDFSINLNNRANASQFNRGSNADNRY